jgi:hypothetical protein
MHMFTKHLAKVIFGFCAVILLGLISLVVLDSMKTDDTAMVQVPAIKIGEKTTATPAKSPCKKPSTSTC